MSESPHVLSASDLVKTYPAERGAPRTKALDGVSFEVPPGTIFGLLGPNGAGKSTTVKILSTLSRADSGTAYVGGVDVARHPERENARPSASSPRSPYPTPWTRAGRISCSPASCRA